MLHRMERDLSRRTRSALLPTCVKRRSQGAAAAGAASLVAALRDAVCCDHAQGAGGRIGPRPLWTPPWTDSRALSRRGRLRRARRVRSLQAPQGGCAGRSPASLRSLPPRRVLFAATASGRTGCPHKHVYRSPSQQGPSQLRFQPQARKESPGSRLPLPPQTWPSVQSFSCQRSLLY